MKLEEKQPLRSLLELTSQALGKCSLGKPNSRLPQTLTISTSDFNTLFGANITDAPELIPIDENRPIQTDQAEFRATSTATAQPRKFEQIDLSDLTSDERMYFEAYEQWQNQEIECWNNRLPTPSVGQVRITCDEILAQSSQLLNKAIKGKPIVCHGIGINELTSHRAIYTALNGRNIKAVDRYVFANSMVQCMQDALESDFGKIPKRKTEKLEQPTYKIRRLIDGRYEAYRTFRGGAEQSLAIVTLKNQDIVIMDLILDASKNHEDKDNDTDKPTFLGKLFNSKAQARGKAIYRLNKLWQTKTGESNSKVLDYDVDTDTCTIKCKVSEKVKFEDERGNFRKGDIDKVYRLLATDGNLMIDPRTRKTPSDSDWGNTMLGR